MAVTGERRIRMNKANDLLDFIVKTDSDRHNPFFGHKADGESLEAGFFLVNSKNQLRYVDPYTKELVSLHPHSKDLRRKCSEGGTGQEIIRQLGRFIMFAERGHMNDYKEVWGWELEPTMNVRKKAMEIGFISRIDYPHERWGE